MNKNQHKRSAFSGKIGFVLSAAGASVGLGNIWRFPYLAAKYGGGIFLLIYIILAFTFGYTMIVAETALGRMTRKSPVGAFAAVRKGRRSFGGWINAIIPILIVPYYSVIGGWVIRYLADYVSGHGSELATDGYFSAFISSGASAEICFVLSAAGASVGLGNIWRFPYLAAKYGGGIFLLIYIILAFTFGYTMIVAETALGRMTRKSPVGAFAAVRKGGRSFGGWINAIIPILIVPYYSVIGGWVIRYLADYVSGHGSELATDGYFSAFISSGASAEICFVIFTIFTLAIIFAGVRNGVERVSKVMMPILVVLSVIIAGYSVTRPGALEGVKYFLVPNLSNFSWMTVVTAMGQMFYSLSIAMGILVTFGSYMKKDVSIEESTENVEIFDTAIAIMAGLMIIPAVFSFSGGDPDTLQAGPALMFITIPKVFESMGLGTVVGILFFTLVLFAAVTSSIALTESAVSTFEDELGWERKQATVLIGIIMLVLGSLSALGYGPLARFTVFGMQFLDFFDFLTNSVMMPIAAITTCLLVSRVIGVEKIEEEVTLCGKPFHRKRIFNFMIKYLCPIFAAIILISSVANALGVISM